MKQATLPYLPAINSESREVTIALAELAAQYLWDGKRKMSGAAVAHAGMRRVRLRLLGR